MHTPKRLYMTKYVLWYIFLIIPVNGLLLEVPPWIYEHIFQAKLAYPPPLAKFLLLLSPVVTSIFVGTEFAATYYRKPDVIDAQILSILCVLMTFSVTIISYKLAMNLYGRPGIDEDVLQKYVTKPAPFTLLSLLTLIIFLFMQYWLVGLSFAKSAQLYLSYVINKKGKDPS